MSRAFDLRHEVAWIPVLYLDGHRATLTLQQLLEDAHVIREVEEQPVQWAALMRFLPSVTALIARQEPSADFDAWAAQGIPSTAVNGALDAIAERLWLRHPDTPFMQEPLIADTGKAYPTEWLHLTAPATSSKAWWGKPGDQVHPDAGTPARIALGLVTSWYFNPGVGGRAVGYYADDLDAGWRPRGTLGTHNHGLRVFHRGRTLAETLLANTMDAHITGRGQNMPLWACGDGTLPTAGPLTASTWTGSAYRVAWEGDTPVGVHIAGRRHRGYSADPKERTARSLTIDTGLWRADPTIPRQPIRKAGEDTGDVRPVRALHPSANSVQLAAEWYVADKRHGAARAMEPGLVETTATDIFTIQMEGMRAACEIGHFARIGEHTDIAAPSARGRLLSLSAQILRPIQVTLFVGLAKALGDEMSKPLHDRLFAAFCADVEDILDEVIHAPALCREHSTAFANAAVTAFERFLTPYMNSQTLAGSDGAPGIGAALAYVRGSIAKTLRSSTA